jgi:hypothetical protein
LLQALSLGEEAHTGPGVGTVGAGDGRLGFVVLVGVGAGLPPPMQEPRLHVWPLGQSASLLHGGPDEPLLSAELQADPSKTKAVVTPTNTHLLE